MTHATVSIKWNRAIHTPSLLVFGSLPTQCKKYEQYAQLASSKRWKLSTAASSFWNRPMLDKRCYKYFLMNPVDPDAKPTGFENGVTIRLPFGVLKVFNSGKGILTISLKDVKKDDVHSTVENHVKSSHEYIRSIPEMRLRWGEPCVDTYTWEIVSINSLMQLEQRLDLDHMKNTCIRMGADSVYEPEHHRGYMQIYIHTDDKRNTVNVYHTGKCMILGANSVDSITTIDAKLCDIMAEYCSFFTHHPQ